MRKLALLTTSLLLAAGFAIAGGVAKSVADKDIGLSKTSVDDVPVPEIFEFRDADPTTGGLLPRAWVDAPPQVPHNIADFVPLTLGNNMCVACHQQPDKLGQKATGEPTPLPATHYAEEKVNNELVLDGRRYVCTQCHTPQAEVDPLVQNTFDKVFETKFKK